MHLGPRVGWRLGASHTCHYSESFINKQRPPTHKRQSVAAPNVAATNQPRTDFIHERGMSMHQSCMHALGRHAARLPVVRPAATEGCCLEHQSSEPTRE